VQRVITALIIINGITLGLETYPAVMHVAGNWIGWVDRLILSVFVLEIGLRLAIHRLAFFRDPWSVFDFLVVTIALVPASGPWSVLRAFRILRVLRLVSTAPALRQVVTALIASIPGMGAIIVLMGLILYVSAVISTQLYGAAFPELFGSLGISLYSLFQVMTLEGWSAEIVRPVMTLFPSAWLFFIPFILLATFTMLNLFIAIIVTAIQNTAAPPPPAQTDATKEFSQLRDQIRQLTMHIEQLDRQLKITTNRPGAF
jgi:voltage-gated sodium channel